MAYDSARGKTVLFGGTGIGSHIVGQGDTWEWDGSAWKRVASTGPPPREFAAMAYDSARGKAVLFGGTDTASSRGDTWEWDGSTWKQMATNGPSPRTQAAMAFDAARGRTVLFGGYTFTPSGEVYHGDTWEWDGTEWSLVATSGPDPRSEAAMAYDSARGRIVLFGGKAPGGADAPYGDTWEWDGAEWKQIASSGPQAREGAVMAFDSARNRVMLFGGLTRTTGASPVFHADTWEWDGSQWTQVAATGPTGRVWPGIAGDGTRKRVVLFGGSAIDGFLNDTWEWDGNAWRDMTAPSPGKREAAAMTYDGVREKAVLFGGRYRSPSAISGYTFFGDTWEWDGSAWKQAATTGPSPRAGNALAWDGVRGRTVLFGGYFHETNQPITLYGDTWEWDGTTWKQAASTGPDPRSGAAMAYDSARGRAVLFGGNRDELGPPPVYFGDTWEWDGSAWSKVAATGPSPRTGAAMAYDSARGRMVLFGGVTTVSSPSQRDVLFQDTWEWDGKAWTQIAVSGPRPRSSAALAYDTARGRTVLYGGRGNSASVYPYDGDTWEWAESGWRLMTTTGPSPRQSAMAYDSARQAMVLFGGSNGVLSLNDTWEYGSLPGALSIPDAADALRFAAGIGKLPSGLLSTYDLTPSGPSAGAIDLQDAVLILRRATGLSPNP